MSHEGEPQPQPELITFEFVVAAAKEDLLIDGTQPPMLIIQGKTKAIWVDVGFPENTKSRHGAMYHIIGLTAAQTDVVGDVSEIFLVREALMSDVDAHERPLPKPSQDPKRREVLIISSVRFHDGKKRAAVIELLCDSKGTLRELKDLDVASDSPLADSPLLNAFVDGYTQGRASPGETEQSQNDEHYNGWKNYQTWCVKVWLDNDEELFWRFEQLAAEGIAEPLLAHTLHEYFKTSSPLEDVSSPFNDLLTHALQQVSWAEIAHALYPTSDAPLPSNQS